TLDRFGAVSSQGVDVVLVPEVPAGIRSYFAVRAAEQAPQWLAQRPGLQIPQCDVDQAGRAAAESVELRTRELTQQLATDAFDRHRIAADDLLGQRRGGGTDRLDGPSHERCHIGDAVQSLIRQQSQDDLWRR